MQNSNVEEGPFGALFFFYYIHLFSISSSFPTFNSTLSTLLRSLLRRSILETHTSQNNPP